MGKRPADLSGTEAEPLKGGHRPQGTNQDDTVDFEDDYEDEYETEDELEPDGQGHEGVLRP